MSAPISTATNDFISDLATIKCHYKKAGSSLAWARLFSTMVQNSLKKNIPVLIAEDLAKLSPLGCDHRALFDLGMDSDRFYLFKFVF